MPYDPFARGPFAVGVRTSDTTDTTRDNRYLPIEIWYPATDAYAGQDLADPTRDRYDLLPGFPPASQDAVRGAEPRRGRYPLVIFSHGFGGHRRQTTFLCTHLASHGYVVASLDHTGNTVIDIMQMVMSAQSGGNMPDPLDVLNEFIVKRPADVSFAIAQMLDGAAADLAGRIDPAYIGMTGHSFGGWTTLAMPGRESRIGAALPLAPAGGETPLPGDPLITSLDFHWHRDVPTLFLVAERDSLLPLDGMRKLYARAPLPKKMVALCNADHMHFCDRVEEIHELFRMMPPPGDFERIAKTVPPISELCPGEDAYRFVRGLGLAHMDAHLKGNESAAALLDGDIEATLAARGVAVRTEKRAEG